MLTSDPFQIISLIGFPKPQIFIFSPVLKARCDNTAAVLKQRRPRKQTQRGGPTPVVQQRCTEGNEEETVGRSRIREEHTHIPKLWSDDGVTRSSDQAKPNSVFFHWTKSVWLVQREVTALICFNWRSQMTMRNKRSWIKFKDKVNVGVNFCRS